MRHVAGWTAALVAVALTAGCAYTAPTHFYLLKATAEHQTPAPAADGAQVVVAPVQVAAYLDRQQMVSRLADSEVRVDEFDRWAEPLADGVRRVFIEDLSRLLSSQRVSDGRSAAPGAAGFRVTVSVLRFDREQGGEVVLTAHWSVAAGQKLLTDRLSTLHVEASGTDVGARVEAQSQALETLSRQIADVIRGAAQR